MKGSSSSYSASLSASSASSSSGSQQFHSGGVLYATSPVHATPIGISDRPTADELRRPLLAQEVLLLAEPVQPSAPPPPFLRQDASSNLLAESPPQQQQQQRYYAPQLPQHQQLQQQQQLPQLGRNNGQLQHQQRHDDDDDNNNGDGANGAGGQRPHQKGVNGFVRNIHDFIRIGVIVVQVISLYLYFHWLSFIPNCCGQADRISAHTLMWVAIAGVGMLAINLLIVLRDMRYRDGEKLLHYSLSWVYPGVVAVILWFNRYIGMIQRVVVMMSFVVLIILIVLLAYLINFHDIGKIAKNWYHSADHPRPGVNMSQVKTGRVIALISCVWTFLFIAFAIYLHVGEIFSKVSTDDFLYFNLAKKQLWQPTSNEQYCDAQAYVYSTSFDVGHGLGNVMEYCNNENGGNTACCEWYY
jgi:hypothetical protein